MYTAGYISVKNPGLVKGEAPPSPENNPVIQSMLKETREVMALNTPPQRSLLQNIQSHWQGVVARVQPADAILDTQPPGLTESLYK